MSKETRDVVMQILELLKMVCQEAAVDGNPEHDKWRLINIHESAQELIDELKKGL